MMGFDVKSQIKSRAKEEHFHLYGAKNKMPASYFSELVMTTGIKIYALEH